MFLKLLFWFIRRLPESARIALYGRAYTMSIRIYGSTEFFIQRLPFGIYLKYQAIAAQEALAIQLVGKHTDIPVPQILDVVEDCYIMTRMEGELLGTLFADMNEDEVAQVRKEISSVVRKLRAMPRPDNAGRLGNLEVVSGPLSHLPCADVNRLGDLDFGPFPDFAGFHSHLFSLMPPNHPLQIKMETLHGLNSSEDNRPNITGDRAVFTHGDLHLRNILVKRKISTVNGTATSTIAISGVIDWTCAGWYPSYWEHVKAVYAFPRFPRWIDLWKGIAEDVNSFDETEQARYAEVLQMEREIHETWV